MAILPPITNSRMEKSTKTFVKKEVHSSGLTSMGDVTFEQLTDEYDQRQSAIQKYMKAHMTLRPVYNDMDQRKEEPTDSDLHSMPDDETEEATADNILDEMANLKAFVDRPLDPLGHLRAEVSSLSNKVNNLESFLAKKVFSKLEESIPRIVANETMQSIMPNLICEPLNKDLNALNTLETRRFENLQKELLTAIQAKVGKSVRKYVRKEMQIVKDHLSYFAGKLDKGEIDIRELINLMKDMVHLLDSANVFKEAKDEEEKVSLKEDMALELAKEAKAAEETKGKQSSTLIVYSLVEKALEENDSEEKVSEEEPPFKRLKQTSTKYSPTPPKDDNKGKGIATEEEPVKQLMPLIEQGGTDPKILNLHQFSISGKKMTLEDTQA
ncbi:hypothetical protein Tco_0807220 [Tanacetum coccineum]